MDFNGQQKIIDMLGCCHRDLAYIASEMGTLDYLNKESLLNYYIFKAINSEVHMWLLNINNNSVVTLASRNIFELYLIMLEVNSNEESLYRFYAQLAGDRDVLNSAFIKKCKDADYPLSESDYSMLQKEPIPTIFENVTTHPFNIRNLAVVHDYLEDYEFFYKLSSKLIHPSALKVFGIEQNSHQYEVVAMVGYHFMSKATDYAVHLYNEKLAIRKAKI